MSVLNEADLLHSAPEFLRRSISPRAFARRVGVSPTTVHKWLNEGLPSARIGARRLIHVDTGDLWLKEKLGIKSATS
jgi:DNA-binding transcriptional regulator YiaG